MTLSDPYPNETRLPERIRRDSKIPSWSPGAEVREDGGEIRTLPRSIPSPALAPPPPDDIELLEQFGLDPDVWTIHTLAKSQWQVGGEWRESFKATFKRRGRGSVLSRDEANDILGRYSNVRRQRTRKRAATRSTGMLCVPVGDLQLGKSEGGGTQGTVERFGALTQSVYELLVDTGGVKRLVLPWLGDCIEGLVAQGGRSVASLDIPITEQVRVYRRLILHQVAMLSPWADHVLVPVVPGNHDETYRQQTMPINDSWAIEGASAASDALNMSGKYDQVQFVFPEPTEPSIVVDVGPPSSPLVCGFTHGHIWNSGKDAAITWWKGQSHGRQPVGQADLLFSAHLHHLRVVSTGGDRTWFQIPALDGGSDWFRRGSGEDAPAGVMSVWLTPGEGSGWQGLTIHN